MKYSVTDLITAIHDDPNTIQKVVAQRLIPVQEAMAMNIEGSDRIVEYTKYTLVEKMVREMVDKGLVSFEDEQTPMGRKLSCKLLVIDTSRVKKGGML